MAEPGRDEWRNWSGSVQCAPAEFRCPRSEDEVVALVRDAAASRRTVRPLGAGHSSSSLVHTSDLLVSMMGLAGLVRHDPIRNEASLRAGTRLADAGEALFRSGLAFHNLGDIDRQSIAGAFSTGTHGSGQRLRNLPSLLVGGRIVTADGSVRPFSVEEDPDLTAAVRVSLGALGILTELTLRLEPAYELRRQEWCSTLHACLEHLPELVARNRAMDFYWYPRSDEVKIRTLNIPGEGMSSLTFARKIEDKTDWSHRIIAQKRELRFEEMEYALPAEHGPACMREIRERIRERHRPLVGWRVLYRTVAADDAWLSPAHGRDTVTISLHQNASLPFQAYFADIEPFFRACAGRPHWGKKHSLAAEDLRPLYPMWERFQRLRRELDPNGVFLSPALRALLEER
jgi:FAD/FMN-containing dehydrogenase